MPTIAQAVTSNVTRLSQANGNVEQFKPVVTVPEHSFSIPPINSSMGLPNRGSFSPDLIIGSDFYSGAQQFRFGQRSSAPPPAKAVTRTSTPQSLINKKLVAPIIGGGTKLSRYNSVKVVVSPALIASATSSSQVFVASGVRAADTLLGFQWVTPQVAGVTILGVRVTGNNQITIDFYNPTAGSLTPTGGSISLFLVQ